MPGIKSLSFPSIVILLLSSFATLCFGQSNPYLHFSVAEGLPSSEVYSVHQDRKGFIWFATDNGVVRYDGRSMDLYQAKEGLADPVVFEFVEDKKDRLWFRSMSGKISYFADEKIHPYRFSDSLFRFVKNSFLQSLYIDSADRVWYGVGHQQGYIDSIGTVKRDISETASSWQMSIRKVNDHYIFAEQGPVSGIKVCTINGTKFSVRFRDTFNYSSPNMLRWRDREYFSFGSAIYEFTENAITKVFQGANQIISLNLDHHDNLWVGYLLSGVECYSSFGQKERLLLSFLSSKSVTKVFQDRQGGYWMSTLQDGVYYVPELSFFTQNLSNSSKIKTVLVNKDKTLIVDEQGKIFLLHNGTVQFKKKLGDQLTFAAAVDTKNNFWVSTEKGTYLLDSSFNEKKIIEVSHSCLQQDPNGFMWGSSGRSLSQFDLDGKNLSRLFLNINSPLLALTKNYIYRFGRIGLNAYNYKKEAVVLPKLFQGLRVSNILSLDESTILVGTLGSGFFVLNEQSWKYKQYSSAGMFNANHIYSTCLVGSDLWLGTEKGIAITPTETLQKGKPTFEFITKQNGIINDRVNQLIHAGDHILAISENGYTSIPETYQSLGSTCFYLQNVLVNNQNRDVSAIKNLNYFENDIEINFKFIDFKNQNIFTSFKIIPGRSVELF